MLFARLEHENENSQFKNRKMCSVLAFETYIVRKYFTSENLLAFISGYNRMNLRWQSRDGSCPLHFEIFRENMVMKETHEVS